MIYYFLGMNIVAFLLFGIDKKRSIDQKYRIPEKILLGISFLKYHRPFSYSHIAD